jgi:hypothetical protein
MGRPNGNALLAWMSVAGFLVAVSWPRFFPSELPLPGLRNLSAAHVGWPLVLVALAIAVFLSVPGWLSKERLLICAGFSICVFLGVAFYVSPVAAILFLFIGANLVRENLAAGRQRS